MSGVAIDRVRSQLLGGLRQDTHAILVAPETAGMSATASPLHRLLAGILFDRDKNTTFIQGNVTQVSPRLVDGKLVYRTDDSSPTAEVDFDCIVVRTGVDSALLKDFPGIHAAMQRHAEERRLPSPLWPRNMFCPQPQDKLQTPDPKASIPMSVKASVEKPKTVATKTVATKTVATKTGAAKTGAAKTGAAKENSGDFEQLVRNAKTALGEMDRRIVAPFYSLQIGTNFMPEADDWPRYERLAERKWLDLIEDEDGYFFRVSTTDPKARAATKALAELDEWLGHADADFHSKYSDEHAFHADMSNRNFWELHLGLLT